MIDIKKLFFRDGVFVKQSVRAKRYDAFFADLTEKFGTTNRSELLWLIDNERPVCRECGALTKYKNYELGYSQLCSNQCARKNDLTKKRRVDAIRGYMKEHYGVDNAMLLASLKRQVCAANTSKIES